jgi:hypothetical protein
MTEQIKSNDEFEDWLEGDYISLKPGETRNLEFKLNDVSKGESTY